MKLLGLDFTNHHSHIFHIQITSFKYPKNHLSSIANKEWKRMIKKKPKLPPNVTFTPRESKMPNPNAEQSLNRL